MILVALCQGQPLTLDVEEYAQLPDADGHTHRLWGRVLDGLPAGAAVGDHLSVHAGGLSATFVLFNGRGGVRSEGVYLFEAHLRAQGDPATGTQTVEVEAERLKLKVGTFECDLSATGMGVVRLDGQPVRVRSLSVDVRAGKTAKVVLEIVPLPSRYKVTATEDSFAKPDLCVEGKADGRLPAD